MESPVTLTMQDQKTAHVLDRLDAGSLTAASAAFALGLSVRQVRRKLKAYRDRRLASVPHQSRGRRPANALSLALVARVAELAEDPRYAPCNNHQMQEFLAEREGISISVSSLRRIRLAAGLRSPITRRAPQHRSKRERKSNPGLMLQIDGSPHHWFGSQQPACTLLAAIDDATSEVFAVFRQEEDTGGYMLLLRQVIRQRGVPASVYADRHTIFQAPENVKLSIEDQLAGKRRESQFARAMRELGVRIIAAHSPQAKGRVENLFGTLQDRLVQELRLASITTIAEANRFLPGYLKRHNARFSVAAQDPTPAYRPAPDKATGERILCLHYTRRVRNDHTISFGGAQLSVYKPGKVSYAGKSVTVRIALDGQISYWQGEQRIGKGPKVEGEFCVDPSAITVRIAAADAPQQPLPEALPTAPKRHSPPASVVPAANNPWRRFNYGRSTKRQV